jgi:preprotein translocase subunit YajC
MLEFLMNALIFAQEGGGDNAAPADGGAGAAGPSGGFTQLIIMGSVIMVMFYFMLIRPNKKRDQERKNMLATLKKNDHVVTVGGIKGIVANVKPEEDEVVLKIDEATGAKLRVVLSSIARIVQAEEGAATEKKES